MQDGLDVVVVCLEALSAWTEKRLGTTALTTGDSRIFVHNNTPSPNIVRVIKSRRMR